MADVDDTEAEKTAAAEIVGSVDDLLLEIFRRVLSEKDDRTPRFKLASKHLDSQASEYCSLSRLRLVSRRWNSLISNNFPRVPKPSPAAAGLIFECGPNSSQHTNGAHSSYFLFLDQSIITTAPFRKTNPADDPWYMYSRSYKVVHSCNGLLLIACEWAHGIYSVCNPTTGKHYALPQVPPDENKTIRGVSLAFDPCKSTHYKVVCVLGLEDNIRYFQFVVYSSKTGSWGKCGKLFRIKTPVCFAKGVFWNGSIHWVGSSKLIRFDPGDDREDGLPGPKVMLMPIAHHQRFYFGESCGHLHYIGLDKGVREIVVHEMMSSDYSASGWVVKFEFDVSNVVIQPNNYYFSNLHDDFNVYAVVRGERSEDTFLVLGTRTYFWHGTTSKILRCNHDNTFETIYYFDGFENPGEHHRPFQFIESLASV